MQLRTNISLERSVLAIKPRSERGFLNSVGELRLANRMFVTMLALSLLAAAGCDTPPPQFRFNAVELRHQERVKLSDGLKFDSQYKQQIDLLTTTLFGTPDEPKFPFLTGDDDEAHAIISSENLARSAGPVNSNREGEQRGLYREHCVHCHGITGDGAGPTALTLNPYPRDFRMGRFKYKSTPLRTPPTDADLERVLRHGIPGTAMPAFATLPEQDIKALIDYVKYLSIRGEFERLLISELGALDGEPLIEIPKEATNGEAPVSDALSDRIFELCGDKLSDGIIARWMDRDDSITEVSEVPEALIAGSGEAFENMVVAGQILFAGKAACMQCHGPTGLGDGLVGNYDDWTNDWLKNTPDVDVNRPQSYQEFLDLGAFPPRPILPRNLHYGVYRGGGDPADLYRRIYDGIEGTPMPSSRTLTPEEIWSVVAYLRSLPYSNP